MNREISPRPRSVKVIDSEDQVGQAVEHLHRFDVLGYDTETFNLFDRNVPAFDPCSGARMRLAQFTTTEADAYVFDLRKVNKSFLHYMFPNKYTCVIQNAKFEEKFLQFELGIYDFGPIHDTMIAEQVTARGRVATSEPGYIPVGLDMIAKRRLGLNLPKDEQKSDWYKDDLSKSQIDYAAMDSTVVLPIMQDQCRTLVEQGQVRVAELEFGVTPAIAWMENNGFRMDPEQWAKVAEDQERELQDIKHELWDRLGLQNNLFGHATQSLNLDSKPQVVEAFQRLGVELPINDDGNVTLTGRLLGQLESRREIDLYMKYVKLTKRIQSFGKNWADLINPYTGRIHCNLKQIGAETGRMSANKPNLMQIPKENEYRNCFMARDGWVLINADYSQCELRILAELCRDPNLLKAFDEDIDLHLYTAHLLYEKTLELVEKSERNMAKNMNFLIVYGGGAYKLATQAEIAIEVAERVMDLYLTKVYPTMGHWLEKQARDILYGLRAKTMTGRTRQYLGDLNDKKFKSSAQRHAKNYPIQGCLNAGTFIMTQEWGPTAIENHAGKQCHIWDGEEYSKARIISSGEQQLVRVNLSGRNYVECSPIHPFKIISTSGFSSWIQARNLKSKDHVIFTEEVPGWDTLWFPDIINGKACNSINIFLQDYRGSVRELGQWLGRIGSDGWVGTGSVRLGVAEHEFEILPLLEKVTAKFGTYTVSDKKQDGTRLPFKNIDLCRRSLCRQLIELNKTVPDFIFSSKQLLAGYLQGFFDGDGTCSIDGPSLKLRLSKRTWLEKIQRALTLFGIRSNLAVNAYSVCLSVRKADAQKFAKEIGFLKKSKQKKCEAVHTSHPYRPLSTGRVLCVKSVVVTDNFVPMYDVLNSETGQFMANGVIVHNTNADITKLALTQTYRAMVKGQYMDDMKLVLPVHDEIDAEARPEYAEQCEWILQTEMLNAERQYLKRVPSKVDSAMTLKWFKDAPEEEKLLARRLINGS